MENEFRIWGRVARIGKRYRAMASAMPHRPGAGPAAGDIRTEIFEERASAQEALGLLAHGVAQRVMARGGRVTRIDVR